MSQTRPDASERLLRIGSLDQRRGAHDVREEHRDLLPLALDGTPGGEDLLGEVLGRVGVGLGLIDCLRRRGLAQIVTALVAEFETRWWRRSAVGARGVKRRAAGAAER